MAINSGKISFEEMQGTNSKILVDLLLDPLTTENTKLKILQKLTETATNDGFFDTILKAGLDFGQCPCCGHENNWLIPEADLNQRGILTSSRDPRVLQHTNAEICTEFEESCAKKKVSA